MIRKLKVEQQQQQSANENDNKTINNNEEQTTSNNKDENNEEITNNNNKKAKKNNKGIKNKYSYKGRPWNERKEEDEHSEDDGGQGVSVDCQQSKRSVR